MDIHNIAVCSVGGVDLLPFLDGFPVPKVTNVNKDASRITRRGMTQQNTKRELEFAAKIRSDAGSGVFVSHLSVGAFALDGSSQIATLRQMDLKGSYDQSVIPSVGSLWRVRRNRRLLFDVDVMLGMPDTGGLALALQAGGTTADQKMAFSITINGVAYTFPIIVREWEIGEDDGEEVVWVRGDGDDPATGAYPSAPTTSTTLLTAAMNDYNTALAFDFQSGGAGDGIEVTGNLKFNTFGFSVRDEELLPIDFSWLSHGAMTVAVAA